MGNSESIPVTDSVTLNAVEKGLPEEKLPILINYSFPINYQELSEKNYHEIEFNSIKQYFKNSNEARPLRIINCPTTYAAVDKVLHIFTKLLKFNPQMIILHFLVNDKICEYSLTLPKKCSNYIVHVESTLDGSSMIYFKLKDELNYFSMLVHPNDLKVGEFIVNEVLAYNLSVGVTGVDPSVKIAEIKFYEDESKTTIHPSMLTRFNEFDLITFAEKVHKLEIAKFLSKIFNINAEVEIECPLTQIDFAYKTELYDSVAVLLNLNSEFPKDFELKSTHPDELKKIVEISKEIHSAIDEVDEEKIEKIIKENPSLKYFYDTNNQSAFAHAINSGAFEFLWVFLENNINLGPHENFNEILAQLSPPRQDELKAVDLDYFDNLHLVTILSNSHVGFNDTKKKLSFVHRALKNLNQLEDVEILLKTLAALKHFQIIFDFDEENLKLCKNFNFYRIGRIYVPAKNLMNPQHFNEVYGKIAHCLSHFVFLEVFNNEAKPYKKNDEKRRKKFAKILEKISQIQDKEPIIDEVFDCFDRKYYESETIVRYPQILTQNLDNDSDEYKEILEEYKELGNFYKDCVEDANKRALDQESNGSEKGKTKRGVLAKAFKKYPKIFIAFMILSLVGMSALMFKLGRRSTKPPTPKSNYLFPICGNVLHRSPSYIDEELITKSQSSWFASIFGTSHDKNSKGEYSIKGQWPWYAPLFDRNKNDSFFCGATLITEMHLLGAAHCFISKRQTTIRKPTQIFTILGAYNIFNETNSNFTMRNFSTIHFHYKWNSTTETTIYEGDIAILLMDEIVTFTNFIYPICIPGLNTTYKKAFGSVVGYGNEPMEVQKYIVLPMVKYETCHEIDPGLFPKRENGMICGGEKGRNFCLNDDGGGFYEPYKGKWRMLGIVSARSNKKCSNNSFITFTDVRNYIEWINATIDIDNQNHVQYVKPNYLFPECGNVYKFTELVIGGNDRGKWPWFASLFQYHKDYQKHMFFCGSSIITKRHLLGASHCFRKKGDPNNVSPKDLYTLIGRNNLDDETEGIKMGIAEIYLHPNWNSSLDARFDGDIAILSVEYEIIFDDYIQPICVPGFNSTFHHTEGFVVGYGLNETKQITKKQMSLKIPTVKLEICFMKASNLADSGTEKMFCAGEKNRLPCKGDSGGGFYELVHSRWRILGIVSHAPGDDCLKNEVVLFTDVFKYVKWINDTVYEDFALRNSSSFTLTSELDLESSESTTGTPYGDVSENYDIDVRMSKIQKQK